MAESRQPRRILRAEDFFQDCKASFRDALAATETGETHSLRLAELDVTLRFAGGESASLVLPALRHLLRKDSAEDAIEISIWDPSSGGTPLPPCPWNPDDHLSRGDVRGYDSPEWKVAYGLGVNVLSLWSAPQRRGLFHPFAPREIPRVYFGSPLLHLLQWIAPLADRQLVHAGAVARGDDALLLVGKGGAGKSTTALACLHGGMEYLADDYCLIGSSPEPRVHSVYSSGKIRPHHLAELPDLEPLVANHQELDREKALLFLEPHFAERIRPSARLRGIVLPRVTEQDHSSFEPAPRPLALRILAASSLFQLAGADASSFHAIATLVRHLPVYQLNAGRDLKSIAPVMDELLDELRSRP